MRELAGIRSRQCGIFRRLLFESLEARSLMASDSMAGIGLLGQYYNETNFQSHSLTRIDPIVNFQWDNGSPSPSIDADSFSVRWSGQIEAVFTERYTFFTSADDGVKLIVDGTVLVDQLNANGVQNANGSIDLVAGRRYDIEIDYREVSSTASVKFEWQSASQTRQVVPTSKLFASERGSLTREIFEGVSGANISALTNNSAYPNSPTRVDQVATLQTPSNQGQNFGERISGYLLPPASGLYRIAVASNDQAEVWLSDSDQSANKIRIAYNAQPTAALDWNSEPNQQSTPIFLSSSQRYYVEVLHKQATGDDHMAVAWQTPSDATWQLIPSEFVSPSLPTVSIFADNPTTSEGASTSPATFTIVRNGSSVVAPLTVRYSTRGTATGGSDYESLSGQITIPANQRSVTLSITALSDGLVEGNETAIIELQDGPGYDVDTLSFRTVTALIQDDAQPPTGGTTLLAGSSLSNFDKFGGTFSTVTVAPYGNVIQAAITSSQTESYNSQLRQMISAAVKAGDNLFAEFYVRSLNQNGNITAVFELAQSPYTKSLSRNLPVTTSWTKVQLPFSSLENYAAGAATFGFHLGQQIQTIQFANLRLLNYGADPKLASLNNLALQNIGGTFGSMASIDVTGQGFTSAVRISTATVPPDSWRLQTTARNSSPIAAGDTVKYSFRVRAASGTSPRVDIVLQEAFGSYTTLRYDSITPTSTWSNLYTITISGISKAYSANELQVVFIFGSSIQAVEVAQFEWYNTRGVAASTLPERSPSTSYGGRSGTSDWRSTADSSIDQNRKSNLTLLVRDADGQIVDDATVTLRQKKHAFKFGSALNGYGNLLTASGDSTAAKYQSEFKRLFNTAVIENNLKWPDFASNRQLGLDAATWVINNSIYLRGHNGVWPSRTYMPASVWSQYDSLLSSQGSTAAANYLRTTIRSRITDVATTFQGIAGEWDVVNEPFANRDVMNVLGDNELLEWYRLFKTIDPNSDRALNDYDIFARNGGNSDHRANFDYWLGKLDAQNLLELIGEQSHYSESNLTDIATLGTLINQYHTNYDLPIAITEFDVNSKDEQLQADYLRDYLTMSFSQPGVTEFLQWGFWTKSHWLPDAALYRDDFSIKPNGQAFEDLVFGDWWTDERGTTWGGDWKDRIFEGDYDIVVQRGSQIYQTTLSNFDADSSLTIQLPGIVVTAPVTPLREGGPSSNLQIVLSKQPTSNVTVALNSNSQWNATNATLTFTPANWNTPQAIAVNAVDDRIAEGSHSSVATFSLTSSDPQYQIPSSINKEVAINDPLASILGRYVYYRGSSFDSQSNSQSAIDTTKVALLSGPSSSSNLTNNVGGITGVAVDIQRLPSNATLPLDQFEFYIGTSNDSTSWTRLGSTAFDASQPIIVLPGQGINGSDRIKIQILPGVVKNAWIEIRVRPTVQTGLSTEQKFYFGNVEANILGWSSTLRIDQNDLVALRRSAGRNDVAVSSLYDIDKDGDVTTGDIALLRRRLTTRVTLQPIAR